MSRQLACVIVLVMLLQALTPAAALAAKPTVERETEVGTFVLACHGFGHDFELEFSWVQEYMVRTFYDNNGSPVRVHIHGHYRGTLTNLDTGFSVPDRGDYVSIIDLGQGTDTVVGLFYNLIVPGEGPILQEIGRVAFDMETGEVIFSAGPSDFTAGDSLTALCAAMDR